MMRTAMRWSLPVLLCATMWAQQPAAKRATRKPRRAPSTASELQQLRDALQTQQQQIQQLTQRTEQMQQDMQRRDQQLQQTQQALQEAQAAATDARTRASAVETAAGQQTQTVTQLQSDFNDVRQNLTTTVVQTQEEQKRISALQTAMGRFRFTGDVRVRQEDFFQNHSGCGSPCNPRIRERIRIRFGVEGQLNEDFQAGMFVASGTIVDPTSTNETLTNFFERKTISWDRGYIRYNPKAHPWLDLTGGKFAFNWIKTNQTFDPDINPEGFSEKLSFPVKSKHVTNVTVTAMQLLMNEVSAPTAFNSSNCIVGNEFCANGANTRGADTYAVGGQLSTKLKFGRVSMTPSYMVLNFRNENAVLNQGSAVTGGATATTVNNTLFLLPTASSPFAPNGITNATTKVGTTANGAPIVAFASRFLYGDAILDTTVDTGYSRFPVRVLLEYLNNMRAKKISPVLGRQSHLYKAETTVGQLKAKGDFQFGYGFWRVEQDAVLATFAESDQRAPTNIVQHSLSGQYNVRNNVTLASTLWIGRTLNSRLVNARLAPGITAGQVEPYLKRMQFDIIYKF